MTQPVRAYLIDDHNVVRDAVAAMLEASESITVVGQAASAEAGIRGIGERGADVVLLDLKMEGMSGLAAIPGLREACPGARIIVFTMYDSPAYVWETINAGASGYLLKNVSKDELIRAVVAVAGGAGYLQAEVTMPLLKRFARDARAIDTRTSLTVRETQMLECLAEGLSNKAVASRLHVSNETVKSHLKTLYDKLGASDRAHAVAIALRQRLIE